MDMAYQGDLIVEPEDFTLEVRRFALMADSLSFHMTGDSVHGPFEIERHIVKTSDGLFQALHLPLNYKQYAGKDSATLIFLKINARPRSCIVSGLWKEHGREWEFNGTLRKFTSINS